MDASSKQKLDVDITFIIIQWLREKNHLEAAAALEAESKLYLNLEYLKKKFVENHLDEADHYLSQFLDLNNKGDATPIFFIRKLKFLQALLRDRLEALAILRRDLLPFKNFSPSTFNGLAALTAVDNLSEQPELEGFTVSEESRAHAWEDLEKMIREHPTLSRILNQPEFEARRLAKLLNYSVNLMHGKCKKQGIARSDVIIDTLLRDHKCVPDQPGATDRETKSEKTDGGGAKRKSPEPSQPRQAEQSPTNPTPFKRAKQEPATSPATAPTNPIGSLLPLSFREELKGEGGDVFTCLRFHPTDTILLAGTKAGKVMLWDLGSEKPSAPIPIPSASSPITRIVWSADGLYFAVACLSSEIILYSFSRSKLAKKWTFRGHQEEVNDLVFFPKEEKKWGLASCSNDRTARIWDIEKGLCTHTFSHTAAVYSVRVGVQPAEGAGECYFAITVSKDEKITVFLLENSTEALHFVVPPSKACTDLLFCGERLFTCGLHPESLIEWAVGTGKMIKEFKGYENKAKTIMRMDSILDRWIMLGDGANIKFWDINSDATEPVVVMPLSLLNPVKAVSYCNELNRIAVLVQNSNVVSLYEGKRPGKLSALLSGSGGLRSSSSSLNTTTTTTSTSATCRIVELAEAHKGPVRCLTYKHHGDGLTSLGLDAENKLWMWEDGAKPSLETLPEYRRGERGPLINEATASAALPMGTGCFLITPNDGYLLSSSGGRIMTFDLINANRARAVDPPKGSPVCVILGNPTKNNSLFIGLQSGEVVMIDFARYSKDRNDIEQTLSHHRSRITGLALGPPGTPVESQLVSTSADGVMVFWGAHPFKSERKAVNLPGGEATIQFIPGTSQLLITQPTRIIVMDALQRTVVCNFDSTVLPQQMKIVATGCSPDGRFVYCAFEEKHLGIFDVEGLLLYLMLPLPVAPTSLSVHPGGDQIAIGGVDGKVRLVEVDKKKLEERRKQKAK